MSGPLDRAAQALRDRLGEGLAACGFLDGSDGLEVDPSNPMDTTGEPAEILRAAQIFTGTATPVRSLLGTGSARYVVEQTHRLEIGVASPDSAWRARMLGDALLVAAGLAANDPTLSGACERVELTEGENDDLPPNGLKVLIGLTVRVRSSDPLGLTD